MRNERGKKERVPWPSAGGVVLGRKDCWRWRGVSVPLFARLCCVLEIERKEGEEKGKKRKSMGRE